MNDKEKELWRVIDNVIKCCAIELPNGELSITREDVLGKSRAENLGVTFAGEIVLATDKADLLPEVGKLVNEADEIIKAYEPSKERKAKGEELLAALNPAIKEKQETEKRFKALEGDISGIRGMVKQLLDKLG